MINFVGANQLAARARKAPLVAAAVIALVMLAAAAVYAACCNPLVFGIMPPESPAPGSTEVDHDRFGHTFIYKVTTSTPAGGTTITRDGTKYVTIKIVGSSYEISDPRGSGKTIIRLSAAH